MKHGVLLGAIVGCVAFLEAVQEGDFKVAVESTVICVDKKLYANDDARTTAFKKKYSYRDEKRFTWTAPEGTVCYVLTRDDVDNAEYKAIIEQVNRIVRKGQPQQEEQETAAASPATVPAQVVPAKPANVPSQEVQKVISIDQNEPAMNIPQRTMPDYSQVNPVDMVSTSAIAPEQMPVIINQDVGQVMPDSTPVMPEVENVN